MLTLWTENGGCETLGKQAFERLPTELTAPRLCRHPYIQASTVKVSMAFSAMLSLREVRWWYNSATPDLGLQKPFLNTHQGYP